MAVFSFQINHLSEFGCCVFKNKHFGKFYELVVQKSLFLNWLLIAIEKTSNLGYN